MGYQQRYMAAAPDQLVIQVIQDPEVLPPHRSKDGMNIWGVRERGGLKTRREVGPRLIQLESLIRRRRTLTLLFQGTLQTRLLATARECGRRWDGVNAIQESITGRLQLLVSEWEGFEAQREDLVVCLADMDVHLSEVDQLTGNTCEKLKQLQVLGLF
ncbi:unnamed protein product [Oreochromis niloticus]|nr:unnamed protein product [Mustela putorius furo]